ncbi:MAG: NAD(P)/FAD-dependent oxidoreductase [Candidatus Nanoarchaeia archaeon]|nr:NAD(P)/FAD-dependent oxidoreductase [Candidatus Haiyanarchaeum thermophilum]MCW1302814.1 NAD(P)/FAD-dependent oxidoreductase [Candidatus Haiyanarchaeum thermophilum]MCW1303495.1 NAD(P)/FAD-dependent oxidoreductase [Candidatus Haiyanarchaeum thermophilum]MCW1306675.1 NAD(P)/FAD-dependent oxidoreductase [Candidatus Haiyanarchaeum thermophilum]MCW1307369.1 NAD(P)/FAD-dependent oxidoreductase [Candidatus Haiyanarchaeum thermophilum]
MRVVIVGAGPAGLFAALELLRNAGEKVEVIIVEKGKDIEERVKSTINLELPAEEGAMDVLCGVGGAGFFSDGKLNFSPVIGGNLLEFMSREEANLLMEHIADIFRESGFHIEFPEDYGVRELQRNAAKAGITFIPVKQYHLGSENLPTLVGWIKREITSLGGKFLIGREARKVNPIHRILELDRGNLDYDFLILAPGRVGSNWLSQICSELGIERKFNPVDVGVRVEFPSSLIEDVIKVNWDPKFHIRTREYDDFVRTFCTNYNGFVIKENYGDFICVNGYARKDRQSENTNLALLVQVGLTEPVENTNEYGRSIAKLATTLGGGKPIIQRLGDLRHGRRSTWDRIKRSIIRPTLLSVTPGDISMAMPHRIITNILEALEKLDKVIPGIANDSTLLYAPEIKFYAMRVKTNRELETSISNVYVAGDGAGVSRGIIGACATGIIAARSILGKLR